jgi:hypothetical protein
MFGHFFLLLRGSVIVSQTTQDVANRLPLAPNKKGVPFSKVGHRRNATLTGDHGGDPIVGGGRVIEAGRLLLIGAR